MSILIIGGDSRLAQSLYPLLQERGYQVFRTTRRSNINKASNWLYLHLPSIDDFHIPKQIDAAVFIGGVTSYDDCINHPNYAYEVNCNAIPKLAKKLLEAGIYVCFVSTNTVFKCKSIPHEHYPVCPGFKYAELKAETESKLQAIAEEINQINHLSIMRLTKNVSIDTSPFGQWIDAIRDKKHINAFNDLYFAPICFTDSAHAIQLLLKTHKPGIFHLSGERDINYYDFAIGLYQFLELDTNLIISVQSKNIGVQLAYNHPVTALGMQYTHQQLGLNTIPLTRIYSYFKSYVQNL